MQTDSIALRKARSDELKDIFRLVTKDESWTQFNGPYFPYKKPTLESFEKEEFVAFLKGETTQLITCDDKPIGSVSYYWECKSTRWLEAGIVIYNSSYWNTGIGQQALTLWISYLFKTQQIERVGLTTWSGNPGMIKCAEKLGMQQEACLRKVRYYKETYYDSIKYGVLREEWHKSHPKIDLS